MEKCITCEIMVKTGKTYHTSMVWRDRELIYKELCHDLWAKHICKVDYIKRITDRSNYDGTRTIEVLYDNGVKRIYIVEM